MICGQALLGDSVEDIKNLQRVLAQYQTLSANRVNGALDAITMTAFASAATAVLQRGNPGVVDDALLRLMSTWTPDQLASQIDAATSTLRRYAIAVADALNREDIATKLYYPDSDFRASHGAYVAELPDTSTTFWRVQNAVNRLDQKYGTGKIARDRVIGPRTAAAVLAVTQAAQLTPSYLVPLKSESDKAKVVAMYASFISESLNGAADKLSLPKDGGDPVRRGGSAAPDEPMELPPLAPPSKMKLYVGVAVATGVVGLLAWMMTRKKASTAVPA